MVSFFLRLPLSYVAGKKQIKVSANFYGEFVFLHIYTCGLFEKFA